MGRRSILLIVAVVIAALGATLVFLYVQGLEADAEVQAQPVQVLAATEQIAAGEEIEAAQAAGKLELKDVPRADVLPGALTNTDSLKGQVALSPIFAGEQILPGRFGAVGSQQVLPIPNKMMAISVQLTDPARVAGFVTPGAKVAIFTSAEPLEILKNGTTRPLPDITKLLVPEVEVIGVGTTSVLSTTTTDADGAETTEQLPKTLLTLAVTQEQAERVIYASVNSELAFGLLTDKSVVAPGPAVTGADVWLDTP